PGKYLPGRIWAPAMQVAELGRRDTVGPTFVANAELVALAAGQSLGLGIALSLRAWPWLALLVAAATVAGSIVVIRQRWIAAIIDRLRVRFAWLPTLTHEQGSPVPATSRALVLATVVLALNLIASASVVMTLTQPAVGDLVALLGAIYLGWTAGYFALPVPAGLGVREASTVALAHWLAPATPFEIVVGVTLVARLWQLAVDVIVVLAVLAEKALRRPGNETR
ncbi:MAG TPA: hypothetical protein VJ724_08910, partial [Tahibacter sp.]|nr:hypothetical protein [Tahibacter sp.]